MTALTIAPECPTERYVGLMQCVKMAYALETMAEETKELVRVTCHQTVRVKTIVSVPMTRVVDKRLLTMHRSFVARAVQWISMVVLIIVPKCHTVHIVGQTPCVPPTFVIQEMVDEASV